MILPVSSCQIWNVMRLWKTKKCDSELQFRILSSIFSWLNFFFPGLLLTRISIIFLSYSRGKLCAAVLCAQDELCEPVLDLGSVLSVQVEHWARIRHWNVEFQNEMPRAALGLWCGVSCLPVTGDMAGFSPQGRRWSLEFLFAKASSNPSNYTQKNEGHLRKLPSIFNIFPWDILNFSLCGFHF